MILRSVVSGLRGVPNNRNKSAASLGHEANFNYKGCLREFKTTRLARRNYRGGLIRMNALVAGRIDRRHDVVVGCSVGYCGVVVTRGRQRRTGQPDIGAAGRLAAVYPVSGDLARTGAPG